MRRTSGARRRHLAQSGFTRVELLVTIVVLGILGAVTVVAIQKSKLTAHRDDCAVKMVQLAKATFQYELGRREYPGYLNRWPRDDGSPYINPATGKQQGVSWLVKLLNNIDGQRSWQDRPIPRIDLFICTASASTDLRTPTSYVANTGMPDMPSGTSAAEQTEASDQPTKNSELLPPRDFAGNGVFFDLYNDQPDPSMKPVRKITRMSSSYITRGDGLSQTIMLTENVDAGSFMDVTEQQLGCVWSFDKIDHKTDPPTLTPSAELRINRGIGGAQAEGWKSYKHARPSSYHPSGVNVVYCDTHTQFLSEDISYYVYSLLMSANGRQLQRPGETKLMMEMIYPRGLGEGWFSEP